MKPFALCHDLIKDSSPIVIFFRLSMKSKMIEPKYHYREWLDICNKAYSFILESIYVGVDLL
jgi:hypothetical protein